MSITIEIQQILSYNLGYMLYNYKIMDQINKYHINNSNLYKFFKNCRFYSIGVIMFYFSFLN